MISGIGAVRSDDEINNNVRSRRLPTEEFNRMARGANYISETCVKEGWLVNVMYGNDLEVELICRQEQADSPECWSLSATIGAERKESDSLNEYLKKIISKKNVEGKYTIEHLNAAEAAEICEVIREL